jgi:polyhydroxyalkanoate synthesis regulator phasin
MKKLVKKNVKKVLDTGFLLSIGVASIAKENLDKLVKDLVNKGKLNEKQGRKLVQDLIKRSKKEREKVKKILKR